MKKILAIAAVAALTAGVSAYAANPFSDVSTSDWAYQAVSELSDQGIVEGYPDGTFKGQQNITRYELAQIIARLMAREDQMNAEQRAIVDKLAAQFADELANLGVRVANVEKRLGNVSWKGDARLQFQHEDTNEYSYEMQKVKKMVPKDASKPDGEKEEKEVEEKVLKTENKKSDSYGARIRLKANAAVNDQVMVKARLTGKLDFMDGTGSQVKMDQLHVVYAPSENFNIDVGRIGLTFGPATYYDSNFDGVIASMNLGALSLQAGYGRNTEFANDEIVTTKEVKETVKIDGQEKEVTKNVEEKTTKYNEFAFVQANADIADAATLGGFYGKVLKKDGVKFWGVNGALKLGSMITVDGEYVNTDQKDDGKDAKLWGAGLTLGEVDTDEVGSFSVGVHYYDVDKDGFVAGGGLDINSLEWAAKDGAKFWVAKVAVAPMKGIELDAYYNFQAKDKSAAERDLGNGWGVELNYAF